MKMKTDITPIISIDQMKDAIKRSGYLLEHRVEQILTNEGYFVETNPVYPDPDTGKSREFDVSALSATRIYRKGHNFIFPTIICECENNSQPIAFFTKWSPISFLHHEEVRVSGLPVKFWNKDGYISFSDFTQMDKYHHYCKGEVSTQYCTFQLKKDRSSWFALHSEEHHNTFDSLIKALDHEIEEHFAGWRPPEENVDEGVNIQVYYPVVILQGQLYAATLKNNNFDLQKRRHIQFRKQYFLSRINEVETYQIDVISEDYLKDYLKIIKSEVDRIKGIFLRKKREVQISIDKIANEAKRVKKKLKTYRERLEF